MSEKKKRILFADDDTRVLSGLRRQLHGQRGEWDMTFVPGGPEALLELGTGPFDAVVTDMCMPMVDGAQVLAHVAFEQPRAARMVLSGNATPDRQRLASSCAHRYLNKPCEPDVLKLEIHEALAMRSLLDELADERLDSMWNQPPGFLLECEGALSALRNDDARVANEVLDAVQGNELLWQRVQEALAAARGEEVDASATPREAIGDESARLVLSAIMAIRFLEVFVEAGDASWTTAVRRAVRGHQIAQEMELTEDEATDTFIAGLLSAFLGESEERRVLDVLSYLLPTWGFTEAVVNTIADGPEVLGGKRSAEGPGPLSALVAARLALGEVCADDAERHLQSVGWGERAATWRVAGAL